MKYTPEEVMVLLENAIEFNPHEKHHAGYTAKELHIMAYRAIKDMLKERNSQNDKSRYSF
jgi:hypothetical protein